MKMLDLTLLVASLNAAVDTGKYTDLGIDEAKEHIRQDDLFPWLKQRLGDDISFTQWEQGLETELTVSLRSILNASGGNERRKWGVQNNGLCLLIAWVNELIQMRALEDDIVM